MIGLADSIRVVVRAGARRSFRWVDPESAERWLGALSIDPTDMNELIWGWERFGENGGVDPRGDWEELPSGQDETGESGQQIVIDLDRRAVWIDASRMIDGISSHVSVPSTEGTKPLRIPFTIPSFWTVVERELSWRELQENRLLGSGLPKVSAPTSESIATKRSPLLLPVPISEGIEIRRVMYEEVVPYGVDQLAQCQLANRNGRGNWESPADFSWEYLEGRTKRRGGPTVADVVAEVHARWLMTPRSDLFDASPRSWLLARRDWVDGDLWDRNRQWNLTGEAPPGLPRRSATYRSACFGTHEIVLYYEMVRDLLMCAAAWMLAAPQTPRATLVSSLHRRREVWLAQTRPGELSGSAPIDVIELERTRVPWVVAAADMNLDCECPFCQMMATSSSPIFSHLDGCNLDPEWPFALMDDFRDWEDWNVDWEDEDSASDATASSDDEYELPGPDLADLGVWPVPVLLLHVAGRIVDLLATLTPNDSNEARGKSLHQEFTLLHEVALDPGWSPSGPCVQRIVETLDGWQDMTPRTRRIIYDAISGVEVIGYRLAEAEAELSKGSKSSARCSREPKSNHVQLEKSDAVQRE